VLLDLISWRLNTRSEESTPCWHNEYYTIEMPGVLIRNGTDYPDV